MSVEFQLTPSGFEWLGGPDSNGRIGKPEAARHNADDGIRLTVQCQACFNDRLTSTQLLPQPVAQHGDGLGPLDVVARLEASA